MDSTNVQQQLQQICSKTRGKIVVRDVANVQQ
jgi:hypothetical protein